MELLLLLVIAIALITAGSNQSKNNSPSGNNPNTKSPEQKLLEALAEYEANPNRELELKVELHNKKL